jgi:hypothetical protein
VSGYPRSMHRWTLQPLLPIALTACISTPPATLPPGSDGSGHATHAAQEPRGDPPAHAPASTRLPSPSAYVATVKATLSGERKDARITTKWNVTGEFTETLEPRGDGFVLRTEAFSGWKGKIPIEMVDPLGFIRPFVQTIGIDGASVTVADPADARAAMQTFMRETRWGKTATKTQLERLLADETIIGLATSHWVDHFVMWAVNPPTPGKPSETRHRDVPPFANREIDMVTTREHRGEAPCPGDATRTCHTFARRLRPDPDQIVAAYTEMNDGTLPVVKSYVEDSEFVLAAEVGTLIPFESRLTRVSNVETERSTMSERTDTVYVFTHKAPPTGSTG